MHSIDPGLLAELAAKHPIAEVVEAARETAEAVASKLRGRFEHHPKQRRFWQSIARRIWALCTRRAGKSDGGVREWLAKAITIPGWRGLYVNETKPEARKIVWSNDLGQGWVNLLGQFGQAEGDGWRIGGVFATKNETLLEINFSNGSQIAIFTAEDIGDIDKLRGQAKDEIWVDEAQKFTHLRAFVEDVASACLKDKRGRLRLTGTPSEDCAGYFYECSPEPESGDVPLKGWEGHRWSVTDNPGFGRKVRRGDGWYVVALGDERVEVDCAGPIEDEEEAERVAASVRWDRTAGEELADNDWTGEEPKFQREWLGKWVKGDARFVYPVHAITALTLVYAPQRLLLNTFRPGDPQWLDIDTALADLPINRRARRAYQWMFAIGADFGYWPDPFALVAWAFTQELPDVYELFSWKQTKVNTDDQGAYMKMLWDALPNVVSFVGDVDGKKDDVEVWVNRMNLPIEPAKKQGKNMLEELLAGDIRKGRVHLREGSPLLTEMKHLVYLPAKPGKTREVDKHRKVNGIEHGDHCCFVAGTLVQTDDGTTPIEDVEVGTMAITRLGPRRVLSVFDSGSRTTWRLVTDDGREIVGTADHPIWTDTGWQALATLTPGVTLTTWENMDAPRRSSSTAGDTGAIQTHRTERHGPTSAAPSSEAGASSPSRSTSRSGSTTTGRSPPATTCTIETATPSTTTPATSCSWSAQTTCESMAPSLTASRSHGGTSNSPAPRRPSGTAQRRAGHGTSSTDEGPWPHESQSRSPASIAAQRSTPRTSPPASATTPASPPRDEQAASTTSSESAPSAGTSSPSGSTAGRCAARTRVLRVEPTGRHEPVYNITVAGEPEFFANGILVHNCDAGRYSFADLTHYLHRAPEEQKPVTPEQRLEQDRKRYEKAVDKADERARREREEAEFEARWGIPDRPSEEEEMYGY
jgi:hypothetical protein